MKKQRSFLVLFGCLLVLNFVLVSCNPDNEDENSSGGEKTVTFSLDKVNSTTFTLTVNGARWSTYLQYMLYGIFDSYCNVTTTEGNSYWTSGLPFDYVQNSSSVITFTLSSGYTSVSGTVALDESHMGFGSLLTDGGPSNITTYKANSAKANITF